MKVKQLIEDLRQCDPEAYIRVCGEGALEYVEQKEGSYDGPYEYIDDQGNYVTSNVGLKVDLVCVDEGEYMEGLIDIHDRDNWNKIKKRFVFNFGAYAIPRQRKERELSEISYIKKIYDDMVKTRTRLHKEGL